MKKRCLCIVIAVLTLLSPVITVAVGSGDYDADGTVSAEDARMVLRCAVGLEESADTVIASCDIDSDGTLSADDARSVLRIALGIDGENNTASPDQEKREPYVPVPVERPLTTRFEKTLYDTCHPYNLYTFDKLPPADTIQQAFFRRITKWCCVYTIHDVFRPALKAAGYDDARVNELAPEIYIPSFLIDYYVNAHDVCEVYTLHEYYDDIVNRKLVNRSVDAGEYEPRVGDILFMTNKLRTYHNGYPTVDHTAQIIKLYSDGTFLCTEGSLIADEPDGLPRVRERLYRYDPEKQTYYYVDNDIVFVLAAAQTDL